MLAMLSVLQRNQRSFRGRTNRIFWPPIARTGLLNFHNLHTIRAVAPMFILPGLDRHEVSNFLSQV